ncbi:hypothetical protein [Paraflavitalea pollutisoli]|uniref:hypothetical protein n=1 Tax=Paraflavitalea pollutisoli TaxID=3034143 RepID=UPI0023EBF478|nr:hypothetical protein [Paraflavitalea sp. H1-2-19X]
MKTSTQRFAGILLISLGLLLAACEREGPMGAEGPQGPDGPPGENAGGGEGGSSVVTFVNDPADKLKWELSDGWGGYGVFGLEGGNIYLPDSLRDVIEKGLAVVYVGGPEDDWYQLPWVRGAAKDEIYEATFQGLNLGIYAKIKEGVNGEDKDPIAVTKIKVVIASAAKTYTLNLNN